MKSSVSEKGQVVIPKPLRDRLGIRPGQELDFEEDHGRLIATKVRAEDSVESVYGILASRESTNALMRRLRGPAKAK